MESPRLDIIDEPTDLIITKRTIQIIRASSPYDYEVYQLANVTGFGFFERSGPDEMVEKGNSFIWVLLSLCCLVISYVMRESGPFDWKVFTPFLSSVVFLLIAAEIGLAPGSRTTTEYGLRISLNSGEDKLMLNRDKYEIKEAVSKIYSFMQNGAHISQVIVRNNYRTMNTFIEGYYQDSIVQRSPGDNYAGDRVSGNKHYYR